MNRPIARLFTLVVVMFAALVAYTSRWTVFDAKALQNNTALNKRSLLEGQYVKRGSVYADDGTTLLAVSNRNAAGVYMRTYPQGSLFGDPIGFAYTNQGTFGLEQTQNAFLAGKPIQQSSVIDQLEGKQSGGDTVYTTLDPAAQTVAEQALGTYHGAVVAIVPSTGAIRVLASSPTYNPNLITNSSYYDAMVSGKSGASEFDRATQAEDAPGSAFKVVTAIAAIDTGAYTPDSVLSGASPRSFYGIPLHNDANTSYGDITLTEALTDSVNTVFAQVAQHIGGAVLEQYMDRLGFYRPPPIDLPSDELTTSGVRGDQTFDLNKLLPPTSDNVDVPLVGIGEGQLLVTPLQMAMVASAVANNGRLMRPHLVNYVTNSDGVVVSRESPQLYSTVMKPSTASAVGIMMGDVVKDGTAEAALANFDINVAGKTVAVAVAGKTGTAQVSPTSPYSNLWFIAYAPIVHPQIAVAVDVEHEIGYGGSVAAPIARKVIQALLEKDS
jgi:peptidoglycan glycosyltransferase